MKRVCPQCGTLYETRTPFCPRDGAALVAALVRDPLVGVLVDERYRLQARIGSGAFGLVYRARHERMPREMAVKLLTASIAREERWVKRFEREMRAQALIEHPNIIEIYDYGLDPSVGYYIAMELLQGEDLATRIEREYAVPIVDAYAVIRQTGAALSAAHAAGIVHRDCKPENIFLSAKPGNPLHVTLLDFGIAKELDLAPASLAEPDSDTDGYIAGSVYTMSPEQVLGTSLDGRSDQYSLGVVIYEMLTGAVPFHADTKEEIWAQHVNAEPMPPSCVEGAGWIIPQLDAVILRMLSKDPSERFPSIDAAVAALESVRKEVEDAWARYTLARVPTDEIRGPLVLPPAPAVGTPGSPRRRAVEQAPRQVLVVDDEESIRTLIRRILDSHGYECHLASGADEAVSWIRAHEEPTAIVLDVLMPHVDGLTLMGAIRREGYEGPVLVCTGLDAPEVAQEALAAGAAGFLNKELDLHRLPEVIDRLAS